MSKNAKLLAVAIGAVLVALYVYFVTAKGDRCAALGGRIKTETRDPVGPLNDRRTGIPKSSRSVTVCVDRDGNVLF